MCLSARVRIHSRLGQIFICGLVRFEANRSNVYVLITFCSSINHFRWLPKWKRRIVWGIEAAATHWLHEPQGSFYHFFFTHFSRYILWVRANIQDLALNYSTLLNEHQRRNKKVLCDTKTNDECQSWRL